MSKILFVNGCVRPDSRTLELARAVLDQLKGTVQEVCLCEDGPLPLDWEGLCLRDELLASEKYDHPMLQWAKEFAQADEVVVAAPYWDLMFPAMVRSYFEAITVSGLTFAYGEDGVPRGLCRAKRLIYVTTAGGPIIRNFGFDYVDALACTFYGIPDTECIQAEGLDIWGANVAAIMEEAKRKIRIRI